MFEILFRRENTGNLELLIYQVQVDYVIFFNSYNFVKLNLGDEDKNSFKKLEVNLNSGVFLEIRHDDNEIYYLNINNNVFIQIGWIPNGVGLHQYIYSFESSSIIEYKLAKERYEDAEVYDLLDLRES